MLSPDRNGDDEPGRGLVPALKMIAVLLFVGMVAAFASPFLR
jgi:hypothetical protein